VVGGEGPELCVPLDSPGVPIARRALPDVRTLARTFLNSHHLARRNVVERSFPGWPGALITQDGGILRIRRAVNKEFK
jgi:hypothetical protein